MLAEWPALPIHIERFDKSSSNRRTGWRTTVPEVNNILAALKHNNRVSKIKLKHDGDMQLRHCLVEMQEPFPMLDYLDIRGHTKISSRVQAVLPDSFLGGSAPLLVHLGLVGIPFPGLPKLLSSANHLVDIHIGSIHIPPDVLAASLSAMKHLQSLEIVFVASGRESRRPHPVTRTVFPALKLLRLDCTNDFVEDFVARLEAPSLERMEILVIYTLIQHEFQALAFSELPQFISRVKAFVISDQAQLFAHPRKTQLTVSQKTRTNDLAEAAELSLTFIGWPETLFLAVPPLHFKRVEINEDRFTMPLSHWQMDVESELRGLSSRFTAATDLFLDPRATVLVGAGLLNFTAGTVAGLFPALQNIFLPERLLTPPMDEGFLKFTTARRLAGLPVTVHNWDKEQANGECCRDLPVFSMSLTVGVIYWQFDLFLTIVQLLRHQLRCRHCLYLIFLYAALSFVWTTALSVA